MRASVIAVLLIACDYPAKVPATADTSTDATMEAAPDALDEETTAGVTYHKQVRPVVEVRCNGCHVSGGIAPLDFTDFEALPFMAPLMTGAVRNGDMPPWMMDPDCRDVRDHRILSEADKAVFAAWKDAGHPMGEPSDYVPPVVTNVTTVGTFGVALTRTQGYAPSVTDSDDYRCFLFDQEVAADTWIRGVRVDPDERALVHHVLLFMVGPESVAGLVAKDAESPTVPGYACQGGSGAQNSTMVAGWVPGSVPTLFPEKAAIPAPKGARFVMQMHYNTLNHDHDLPVPGDTTGGWLELLPAGETPSHEIAIRPILDPVLSIQPDDPAAVEGMTFPVRWGGQVVGVAPHMHTRGTQIRVNKAAAGGGDTCVADIPAWDFHWQQTYIFEPQSYVPFDAGDSVSITCVYDNSADNQPLVGGEPLPPQLVTWGEETTDEMCLAYLVIMTPFDDTPAPVGACAGFGACYATCATGDAPCAVQCLLADGTDCAQCGINELFMTCGADQCPAESTAFESCLAGCGGNKLQCAATTCKTESAALYGCLETPLRNGFCDGPCGIAVTP